MVTYEGQWLVGSYITSEFIISILYFWHFYRIDFVSNIQNIQISNTTPNITNDEVGK